MNALLALCFVMGLGNILKTEQENAARLSELLQKKLELLTQLESDLLERGVEIPENLTSAFSPDDFTPYFKFKAHIRVPRNIQCLDLAATGESGNSVIMFTEEGTLHIFEVSGKLVLRTELGATDISHCSTLTTTDQVLISYIHSNRITVGSLILNPESINNPIYTQIHSEWLFNGTSGLTPTAFTNYMRMGKKYWIVGDSQGGISLYSETGEFRERGLTGLSSISSLDRVSQQLIFSGDKTTGIYNLGSMEVYAQCENSVSPIYISVLDYSSTVIYGGLENGDIIVYDTKYSVNNSPVTCKPIARLVNHRTDKHSLLATSKHFLLSWDGEVFTAFSNSYLKVRAAAPPYHYTVKDLGEAGKPSLKSLKTSQGNSIVGVSSGNSLMVFELLSSAIKKSPLAAQENSGLGIDFGYIRVAAIIIGVLVVVFYRMKNRKSRALTEVEKLERSLEGLQHSVNKSSKMTGSVQKRMHRIEEETTKTVRFAEDPEKSQHSSDED